MASASQVSRALRGPMVTIALVGFYPTKGFAASVSRAIDVWFSVWRLLGMVWPHRTILNDSVLKNRMITFGALVFSPRFVEACV